MVYTDCGGMDLDHCILGSQYIRSAASLEACNARRCKTCRSSNNSLDMVCISDSTVALTVIRLSSVEYENEVARRGWPGEEGWCCSRGKSAGIFPRAAEALLAVPATTC